jgi:hypothetical protein
MHSYFGGDNKEVLEEAKNLSPQKAAIEACKCILDSITRSGRRGHPNYNDLEYAVVFAERALKVPHGSVEWKEAEE